MRLTLALGHRRRALRVHIDRALDYPPGHVPALLAAAVATALTPPPAAEVELPDLVPAPRPAPHDEELAAAPDTELGAARLRRRVLRALDDGATVEQAAREFGIDPARLNWWDDDAALDARTDLLADPLVGPARREVS